MVRPPALRLLALFLVLCAGTAAAAPPCLDALLADGGCAGGLEDHGCEDGCCDDEDCTDDCEACPCCPLRAPATVTIAAVRLPTSTLGTVDVEPTLPPLSRVLGGVFRPPRPSA